MNYKLFFWFVIGVIAGRVSTWNVYVGPDRYKYERADIGILLIK